VAFISAAPLVPGDSNGATDVFVRDRTTGFTERISEAYCFEGICPLDAASGASSHPSISADGRYVVFTSTAHDLVPEDGNGATQDVFVTDRVAGGTQLVSVTASGSPGNAFSFGGFISSDGRWVGFTSNATNLVAGDTNGAEDVFLRDMSTAPVFQRTFLVTTTAAGGPLDGDSVLDDMDPTATYFVFRSDATNLPGTDTNGVRDLWIRNLSVGASDPNAYRRISTGLAGAQTDAASINPSMSDDATRVTWTSAATNVVAGDDNDAADVFVTDLTTGSTAIASLQDDGQQFSGPSLGATLSSNGRYAAILLFDEELNLPSVYVRDLVGGTTELASVSEDGEPVDATFFIGFSPFGEPDVTPDGRYVVFNSSTAGVTGNDTNTVADVFVRDRAGGG
jgi:Tol biopolymer transport system component